MAAAKKRGRPRRVWFRKLRQCMASMSVTFAELADALGIDETTVSRKLSGVSEWNLDEIHGVLEYLHLPAEEMYLYFPRNGEDVESIQHQHVREYLEETQQALVPKATLAALGKLVGTMCPDTL